MQRLDKITCLLISLLAMTSSLVLASTGPTIVLVHGALFTETGFLPLKAELEAAGASVTTLNVPGRGNDGIDPKTIDIHTAAAKVCSIITAINGPVMLVGHSQGGAVITQAFGDCGANVVSLVYLAAVVPANGETAFDGLSQERDVNFGKCVTLDSAAGLFRLNPAGPLEASFFKDLRAINAELADQTLASMVSEPLGIGTSKLNFDQSRFDLVPKFYIEATDDQVISIETQRHYQDQVHFEQVYSLATSHSGFLSQPKAVADAILNAASRGTETGDNDGETEIDGNGDSDGGGFDEVIWSQDLLASSLSQELSSQGAASANVRVRHIRNQEFKVTLTIANDNGAAIHKYEVPITQNYSDFCDVAHFDGEVQLGGQLIAINVTDFGPSDCFSVDSERSTVELLVGADRSLFDGPALKSNVPSF